MSYRALVFAVLILLSLPSFCQSRSSATEERLRAVETKIASQDLMAAESDLSSALPQMKGWALQMRLLRIYGTLRDAYAKRGLFPQANAADEKSNEVLESLVKDPNVRPIARELRAKSLESTGDLLMLQQRFAEARKLLDDEVKLLRLPSETANSRPVSNDSALLWLVSAMASSDQRLAQALEKSGNAALMQRDMEGATSRYQEAVAAMEQVSSKKPGNIAALHSRIGNSYLGAKHYTQAIAHYEKALALAETDFGSSHPYIAERSNALAVAYTLQGDYGKAEPLFNKAISTYGKIERSERPLQLAVKNYAAMLRRASRPAEASELESRFSKRK